MCHHTLLARPHFESLKTQYPAFHLNERHVASQLPNRIYTTAIDVFIRIIHQQVAEGANAQFRSKNLLSVWSYAWQILYVLA